MPGDDELASELLDEEMDEAELTDPQNQSGEAALTALQRGAGAHASNPTGAAALPPAPASATQVGQQTAGQPQGAAPMQQHAAIQPQGGTATQQQPAGHEAAEDGRGRGAGRRGTADASSRGRGRGASGRGGRGSSRKFHPYVSHPPWYRVANLADPGDSTAREQLRSEFHDGHPCQSTAHVWRGQPPLHTNRQCGHQRWGLILPSQPASTLVLCSPPSAGAGPSAGPLAPVAQPIHGPAYGAQPSTQQVLGVSNVVQTPGATTVVVNTADAAPILAALQQGMFGARR